jgi:sugar (pentulose or hexulose) kinase
LPADWFPPVFDGHVTTGRITEEGIRRTSLPGGSWIVAGSLDAEAAAISAGDLRDGRLWAVTRAGKPALLAIDAGPLPGRPAPPGWRSVRSPVAGQQLLEREAEGPEALDAARGELEAAGIPVPGTATAAGDAALGAAALAAVGSGLVKTWDRYHRDRARSSDEAAGAAGAGK